MSAMSPATTRWQRSRTNSSAACRSRAIMRTWLVSAKRATRPWPISPLAPVMRMVRGLIDTRQVSKERGKSALYNRHDCRQDMRRTHLESSCCIIILVWWPKALVRILGRWLMSTVETPTLYSPEDLLTMPDGDLYELVDGHLVERNMGAWSSYVGSRLHRLIGNFCEENGVGWYWAADASYQCFLSRPRLVRKPDVSFIRVGRLPGEKAPEGHIRIAPDL